MERWGGHNDPWYWRPGSFPLATVPLDRVRLPPLLLRERELSARIAAPDPDALASAPHADNCPQNWLQGGRPMHWNEQYKAWICTGLEYQEVLRKKYDLPAAWKPSFPDVPEPSTSPEEAPEPRPHAPSPEEHSQ
jgi:hypothetical protein